jgi:hypothetical protein
MILGIGAESLSDWQATHLVGGCDFMRFVCYFALSCQMIVLPNVKLIHGERKTLNTKQTTLSRWMERHVVLL